MSILNSIRKLSNNLLKQVQEQSSIIDFFEDGSCETFTSCIPNLNVDMTVNHNTPWEEAEIIVRKGDTAILHRYPILDGYGDLNPNFEEWFDTTMRDEFGPEVQLSSFQNSAISTANMYTAITEMNNLFTTKVKVKASDLNSLISNDNLITTNDKGNLSALVTQAADDDGNVSQYSWLSIVKAISTEPSQASQQTTIQPVSGSPFTIQSFWNLMKKVVLSTISAVLDAISLVFQGIIAIVSIALSFITKLISNIAPTNIEVNIDDESDYIYGAIINLSLNHGGLSISNLITNMDLYTAGNNAVFIDGCGVDHWIYEIDNTHIGMNTRLKVNVHPKRLLDYVRAHVSYSYENGNTVCVATINNTFGGMNSEEIRDLMLTDEESMMMNYDFDFAARVMMASVLSLGLFQLPNIGSIKLKVPSLLKNNRVTSIYQIAEALLLVGSYVGSYDSVPPQTDMPQLYKSIYDTINAYYNVDSVLGLGVRMDESTSITTLLDDGWSSTITNTGYVINHDCLYKQAGIYISLNECTITNIGEDYCYITDSIYSGWSFKPAEFTVTQVITAIVTVLGIVTAMFVGGSLVKKALNNRKRIKQLDRSNQLAALRDAYVNNPTQGNAKALNKAVNKYNRQAKMFGWDSYDVTNAWFNAAEDSNVSNVIANGLTNSLNPTEQIIKVIKG